jgi:hypothetical protein
MTSQVLKALADEIEWLSLERLCFSPAFEYRDYQPNRYRYGSTVRVRQRPQFLPITKEGDYGFGNQVSERFALVNIVGDAHAQVDDPIHFDAPWDEVCRGSLRPVAMKLAQGIEGHMRMRRGTKLLLTIEQDPANDGFARSVVASNQDLGLSVRGTVWRDKDYMQRCHFDMLFGMA